MSVPLLTERVERALDTVGFAGLGARLPAALSGGQQQRVAVARALVLEPAVLLFDEPLSNLDARLRRRMREEIRELQQRLGMTVVYVTHDQAEAMAVSDRIIVMNRAVIAQEGSPEDLYARPADRFVAGFMGEANVFEGTLVRRVDDQAEVEVGSTTLRLPHRGLPLGPVVVSIRAEAISMDYGPRHLPGAQVSLAFSASGTFSAGRMNGSPHRRVALDFPAKRTVGRRLTVPCLGGCR